MQRHLAFIAALGLAACGPTSEDAGEAARQAIAGARITLTEAPPAPAPAPPPPPPPALPLAGQEPEHATSLAGRTPEQLRQALGEPSLRRAEGPVVVWLYAAAGCQLDVMFYETPEGARVAYAQARAGGFAQRSEAACLAAILQEGRRRPARPAAPAEPTA